MAAGIAVLVSLPAVVRALPARSDDIDPATLLARINGSASVGHQGYAESRGLLALPDVDQVGDLTALLGETTRLRVWWADPAQWRVDRLDVANEIDHYQDPRGSWVWESTERRSTLLEGEPAVRLPRPADAAPGELTRRLLGAADPSEVTSLPARRVAGRDASGLRVTPTERGTIIGQVDVWADAPTGLPLRVEVTGVGRTRPDATSTFLDVTLTEPDAARTTFTPPDDGSRIEVEQPDLARVIDRFAPYALPDNLAGLPRTERAAGLEGGGSASYGEGYALMVVFPLPQREGQQVIDSVQGPLTREVRGIGRGVSTPLLELIVMRIGRQVYVLGGTVTADVLVRAALQLRAVPPQPVRPTP